MTAADKLRELLATRPEMPTTDDLFRWWDTSAELLRELLSPKQVPTPLDDVAENVVVELHDMSRLGVTPGIGMGIVAKLIGKVHALAVVHADTRSRVRALEQRPGLPRTVTRG